MKPVRTFALFIVLECVSSSAFSIGACTYREAIMALERGNTVRGMALMRMAHRDGDERASQFLAKKDYLANPVSVASSQQGNFPLSLNQAKQK